MDRAAVEEEPQVGKRKENRKVKPPQPAVCVSTRDWEGFQKGGLSTNGTNNNDNKMESYLSAEVLLLCLFLCC